MALQTARAQSPKLAKTNKKYTKELKHQTQGSEQKKELPHAKKGSWLQLERQGPGVINEAGGASENVSGSTSLSEKDSSASSSET